MKILRLTTLLDFGGQERKYISFTENPELLHHQYVFAAIGYGGNAESLLRERGFEVHILNRDFSIRNLSNILAVYKLIKKLKPDVVHTAAAEANFHGIIAAKLAGVKYIIGEEIGIPNHSKIAQFIFRQIYKAANKIICVSQSVKNHLIKTGEIPERKGVVIYNPVSVPKMFEKKSSDAFQVVYVGRLEKVKNVETLIKAFAKIHMDNIQLTIVGDGRERENLENLTKSLKQSEKIIFKGFQTQPSRFLCSADLYVLPSFSEGFGIAAVEAMFLKIPVLATHVGGIPEFIRQGENGWLFNPQDEAELAEKIKMILSMRETDRIRVGEKGYENVHSEFTVTKYVENLERLYDNP